MLRQGYQASKVDELTPRRYIHLGALRFAEEGWGGVMISTRDLILFRIQRTLEVWSSMPIRAKLWLLRVSHGAGAGSAPPRVVVCLRGSAGKFTNLERTNPYVHAAITGGAALHTFESHAGVQCAPGELFYLRMGRQDSRQQGPTPNLSRPRHPVSYTHLTLPTICSV